ncbi:MAG TPA: hypothetical protein VJ877_00845, partial [Bacteroidales bacterium]|nr:hypothetical protein [Bacteroidales bacterium]
MVDIVTQNIVNTEGIEILGSSIFHYLLYFILLLFIAYLVVRYQKSSLVKTRKLLRDKETAYEKI